MKKLFAFSIAGALMGGVLTAVSMSSANAGGSVGPPNPLQWKTVTETKCSKSYKATVTRGVNISSAVSAKRRGVSQGKSYSSAGGATTATPYYYNYVLKADRVTYCNSKSRVTKSYLPVKFKRFHRTYNVTKAGMAYRTVIVRSPSTGFNKCYRAYLHSDTRKTRTTCDGESFS